MKVVTIDPIVDTRWDDFVNAHPDSTIFHHSAWCHVLHERYDCSPTCYVLEDEHGEIVAGVPFVRIESRLTGNRLTCLPSSEYCYPLTYSQKATNSLVTVAKEYVHNGRATYLEFRGWQDLAMPNEQGLTKHDYFLRHVLVLDDNLAVLRDRLNNNRRLRRNLRKADGSGLTVREARCEDDLKSFYRLTILTRRRLHLLPWPYRYLQSIYKNIVTQGFGFLLLAEINGRAIAGSLYLSFKDTTLLKINASDKDYARYMGNYLVTWKAIERTSQEGRKYFDFGITGSDSFGLIAFKRQWGTNEVELPYYYYSFGNSIESVPQTSPRYRQAYIVFNKLMPDFILTLAANILYRHMG